MLILLAYVFVAILLEHSKSNGEMPAWVLTASVRRESDFRKPFCDSIQLRRKRASCSKIKLIYSVNGESVRRKAIFGSRAAIKLSFEKGSVLLIEDQTDLQC
ncbi:hypothetical protein TNCV_4389341 [Trichonephila clavipes]|nr:hypothetical protein TNCV_4389341 [Trichonephila clavipes]